MSRPSTFTLDDRLVQFLQAGHPIQVGTRNAFNKTAYTRSWGCKVNEDRQSVILFPYGSYCLEALENISDNGVFAAVFIDVFSYETYQLKGTQAKILNDMGPYEAILEAYSEAQADMVSGIGLPPVAVDHMAGLANKHYVPVYCPIEDCFKQTPGPGAGDRVRT